MIRKWPVHLRRPGSPRSVTWRLETQRGPWRKLQCEGGQDRCLRSQSPAEIGLSLLLFYGIQAFHTLGKAHHTVAEGTCFAQWTGSGVPVTQKHLHRHVFALLSVRAPGGSG